MFPHSFFFFKEKLKQPFITEEAEKILWLSDGLQQIMSVRYLEHQQFPNLAYGFHNSHTGSTWG